MCENECRGVCSHIPRPQVDSITIPVGPRLGSKVVEAKGIAKAFGDRVGRLPCCAPVSPLQSSFWYKDHKDYKDEYISLMVPAKSSQ